MLTWPLMLYLARVDKIADNIYTVFILQIDTSGVENHPAQKISQCWCNVGPAS